MNKQHITNMSILDYFKSLAQLKLLIIDVDGVMTDGTKIYDKNHEVVSKRYADMDFTAIRLFNNFGVRCVFLSGDRFNENMALKRKIPFFYSRQADGSINKAKHLLEITNSFDRYHPLSQIGYVGDDYFDLSIMKKVGLSIVPSSAPLYMHDALDNTWTTACGGGTGVIAEILSGYLIATNQKVGDPYDLL